MNRIVKKILVIAPHADDEILGCGGTIFKELAAGNQVHVLLITRGYEAQGFSKSSLELKERELETILKTIPYQSFTRLDLPAVALDTLPRSEIVGSIHRVVNAIQPDCVYIPFAGDVHTDHQIVSESAWAALKAFRAPSVSEIYAYEVPSETGYQDPAIGRVFNPNTFVDISATLEQKISAFKMYDTELQTFPLPRSEEVLLALATLRGSLVNVSAAEAFVCLRKLA